jgi:hypothetical protein
MATDLYRQGTQADQAQLDALAQRLWRERLQTGRDMLDAVAWACKALGQSRNPRYRQLLRDVMDDAKVHAKVKKYAGPALRQLPESKVEQFRPK